MLISHKYRFIFIKTHKTAGTSIEVDLGKHLGPDDVITPIIPPVEGHEPRNHRGDNWLACKLRKNFWNHMSARRVRWAVGRGVFDSYYKFCVEREPVSKCISHYNMLRRSPDHGGAKTRDMSWEDYLDHGKFPENANSWLDKDGTLLVDRILKYENLHEELADVCNSFGIELAKVEAKAKTGFSAKVEVTDLQRQRIYDAFSRSLPHTGYTL